MCACVCVCARAGARGRARALVFMYLSVCVRLRVSGRACVTICARVFCVSVYICLRVGVREHILIIFTQALQAFRYTSVGQKTRPQQASPLTKGQSQTHVE